MKLTVAIAALLATSAAAFAPATPQRSSTALNVEVDRRVAFGQIAAGAATVAAFPQLASADGAVSTATITRSRALYGGRIADLKKAVESGDLAKVVEEKNSFILFNSGAYPRVVDKQKKKEAISQTNAIFAAIRSGDKAAAKKAYSEYVAANGIKPLPAVDASKGQGYSTEFDFKSRTPAGTIYVR